MKNNRFIDSIKNQYRGDKLFFIEALIVGVMLIFTLLTMYYQDNMGIFLCAFWNVEGIFHGNGEWLFSSLSLPYGLGHQLACEVWAFPMVILYHIFGMEFVNSMFARMWYKLFSVLFLALSTKELIKIGKKYNLDEYKAKYMVLYLTTSLFVAMPVFHIAQTDVLYLFLMLWGFRAYLENNYKLFVLLYAIAFPMKYISIIVFIPLVLIREKRILYVLRDFILGVILFPVEKVIRYVANSIVIKSGVLSTEVSTIAESDAVAQNSSVVDVVTEHFWNKMLFFEFPGVRKGLSVSTLTLIMVLIFIFAYTVRKDENNKFALYISTVSLMVFFLLSSPSPYWIVLMYPFLMLLLFAEKGKFRINMLLEMAFSLCLFLVYIIETYWVFGGSCTFDWLLLERLGITQYVGTLQEGICVAGYINKFGIEENISLVTAVVLATAIALIVINYPKLKYNEELDDKYEKQFTSGMSIFRVLVLGVWLLMNLLLVGRVFLS